MNLAKAEERLLFVTDRHQYLCPDTEHLSINKQKLDRYKSIHGCVLRVRILHTIAFTHIWKQTF